MRQELLHGAENVFNASLDKSVSPHRRALHVHIPVQILAREFKMEFLLVYFIGQLSDPTYRLGSVTIKKKCFKLNCLI